MTTLSEGLYIEGRKWRYELITDNAIVHNENDDRKKDPANGFSPERHFQHIGAVPVHIWHRHCREVGFYEMDNAKRKEEIIKFLNKFHSWRTVESIRTETPNEGHVIIK